MQTAPSSSDSPSGKRIAAVKSSLRCFVYGLLGLVPVIGLPFAVAATLRGRQVPGAEGPDWNPADRYLGAARRLGPVGFLTSATFVIFAICVLPALWGGIGACSFGPT